MDGGATSPGKEGGVPSARVPSRLPADGGLPSANAYADVNVPADFTEPTVVPPPMTTITGDASPFVGSWIAQNRFTAEPCTAGDPTVDCMHIDIQVGQSGQYGVTFLLDSKGTTDPRMLPGPFPSATDASVGYPPGATLEQLSFSQLNLTAGVTYHGLDAVAESAELDFSLSTFEVWNDWCPLQTGYEWNIDGDRRYRCVPQTADATVDLRHTNCVNRHGCRRTRGSCYSR